ncbi:MULTISPECIES: beta-glucosidase family protein [unclassified Arthrobacter]|uniref:beta-glucosidase family protein n=1 Tax=unclassified Arthrobacter TaxID=235627 RepID=UPI0009E9554C|nr:glycoside hydrolase family 3 C-terminal domain-containing protein [Arthrobacter sp. Leaf141]
MTATSLDADVEHALSTLPLEDKVALISGDGLWSTRADARLGLPRVIVSDGPVGVRGHRENEQHGSANFPSGTGLAASWDRNLLERIGRQLAAEARRAEVDVVLGPTINLHRSPLAGRNFECYSEDPLLTGDLAAAYVTGIQSLGIGACPKHFVANEAETDRTKVNNVLAARTLREAYLAPFENVVRNARPWMVMAAYNGVNGAPMTENALVAEPLKGEWGFDGAVVSDWHAVYSTTGSALAATDLAMPGPEKLWGAALVEAVRGGQVAEAEIDRKIRRLLTLGRRVTAGRNQAINPSDAGPLARATAAAGTVLLENRDGMLPLRPAGPTSIALIGPAALDPRTQGGGSASVYPDYTVPPAAGLRNALGEGVRVTTTQGAWLADGLREPRPGECTFDGAPVQLRWLDAAGAVLETQAGRLTTLTRGRTGVPAGAAAVELSTLFTPHLSGSWQLGYKGIGLGEVTVDGVPVATADSRDRAGNLEEVLIGAPDVSGPVELTAGTAIHVALRFTWAGDFMLFRVGLGVAEPRLSQDAEIAAAVQAAREAEVAVVMVGTSGAVESEGFDRTSLRLPGAQDELVAAVIAANPRTVVVVNAGAPVEMPWRHDAAAVLLVWFPGMEMGNALADVLLGAVEPGGHLPTTWPALLADAPVTTTAPRDGELAYTEGVHLGHRGWARQEPAPAYWFGHGLSYTTFAVSAFSLRHAGAGVSAVLTVKNTGTRAGKYVAQVYASAPGSEVDRPAFWLAGFGTVQLAAGESADLEVLLPVRSFEYWDEETGWVLEPTLFQLAPASDAGQAAGALAGPLAAHWDGAIA